MKWYEQKISEFKPDLPPTGDAIDLLHIRSFTDGNQKEEELIFSLFMDKAHLTLKILNDCSSDEWHRTLHALKGAAGTIGAKRLFNICRYMENKESSDISKKETYLNYLRQELTRVENFISNVKETI